MSDFQDRIIRAVKLDKYLYEEVEADRNALSQAMGVVVLSSLAAGIGNVSAGGIGGILSGTIIALIGWYVWAYITYFVGTKFLPGRNTEADLGELLRTTGFAAAPGLIRILGIIPFLRNFVLLIAFGWMLIAMVIAVRQALDYETSVRAIAVCLVGFIIYVLITAILLMAVGSFTQ